jgi:hypothetical protein
MFPEDLPVWLNHFEHHARHPRSIPTDVPDVLMPHERRLIARSIAIFQLGEQAEGRTLTRAAQRFSEARRLSSVARIVELFIREEQRHAALLREFMEHHGIALKSADWTDAVFRRIRRFAGLELYLYVFISAELIGNVYYRALESATNCQRLKVLCRVLVSEELAHVGFESDLLLGLRGSRAAPTRALLRWAHRAFFVCTACIVWATHRPVLGAAGMGFTGFLKSCLAQYSFYLEPAQRSADDLRRALG